MMHTGRHFLQIPGPTNLPDRVLNAMHRPILDHRGAEFSRLASEVLENVRSVFQTAGPVIIFPGSGTGAWEAALVNTLSPGDRVLMFDNGHFSHLWKKLAEKLCLNVQVTPGSWRRGVSESDVAQILEEDREQSIKAVMVVHNETSTGVASRILDIRRAMDRVGHPALFMVDTISSLCSMEYKHDEWGVDVTIGGSQKGLMLPPGLGFNAVSKKALSASRSAKLPRYYWDWQEMLDPNRAGFFPYTPATTLLYGLKEALIMLQEEGLENVFRRHDRHAEATRTAVRHWGMEIVCENPREYSSSLTAILTPAGHDADRLRKVILDAFDMSLGAGLSRLAGTAFRIGHLGHFNDLMLAGTLSGVEMGLKLASVPHREGGAAAALQYLVRTEQEKYSPIMVA